MATKDELTRYLNIMQRAVQLGYTFDATDNLDSIEIDCENFLFARKEVDNYCENDSRYNHEEHGDVSDVGYFFSEDGELKKISGYELDDGLFEGKTVMYFYDKEIDDDGNVTQLYVESRPERDYYEVQIDGYKNAVVSESLDCWHVNLGIGKATAEYFQESPYEESTLTLEEAILATIEDSNPTREYTLEDIKIIKKL